MNSEGVSLWRGRLNGVPEGYTPCERMPEASGWECIGTPAGPQPGSTPAAGNNPNPSQAWGGVTELRCLVCEVITDCGPKGWQRHAGLKPPPEPLKWG
jgi:hypothetical protein